MQLRSPFTRLSDVEVFSVGVTDAQVTWRGLGAGHVTVELDGAVVAKGADARLGAATVDELAPGHRVEMVIRPQEGSPRTLVARTLNPPPGDELCRFATLSDLHLGTRSFGLMGRIRDEGDAPAHAPHCARAAVAEAREWGAERLYLKGDLTHQSRPADWDKVGRFLDGLPIPHHLILGNHDVQYRKQARPADAMARVGHQRQRVHVVDHDGLRVILVDLSTDDRSRGSINADAATVLDAATVDSPVLLATHFHFHRSPVPWFWPLGIGYRASNRFIAELARTNPRVAITTGHTHRNRSYRHGRIPITEVGSPKDYPGVWAGYAVYEGGLVQTVRRVAEPAALAWTDRTRQAVAGVWGMWSPGSLHQRNISHSWR